MSSQVEIAAIQMSCQSEPSKNLDQAIEYARLAASNGARLICLQELFLSRYFCQSEDHQTFAQAEPIPGPTSRRLCDLASELEVVIVAGIFERRTAGLYHNSAVVIESTGELLGLYRKMHIPDDPFYYEKFYFTPGDLGFRVFETTVGKIGVCICWDQWFPEAARITALQGAEVLVYPTAIGWLDEDREMYGEAQRNAWQTILRSHAIANGLFVVAPNRVGREDNIQFWGSSLIANPYGEIIASGKEDAAETVSATCDLSLIETARTHWPFLRDRRIDAFGDLQHRFIDRTHS